MMLALCVHVCVCVHICLWSVRVCLYMCVWSVSLWVFMSVCVFLCVFVCVHVFMPVCVCTYMCLWSVSFCECLCVCVYTCVWAHKPVYLFIGPKRHQESWSTTLYLSPLFECLSLNLESQCAPVTLLSLPPKSWGYRHMPSYAKLFVWMWGFEHSAHSFLLSYHPSSSCELFHEQSLGKNIWIPCYSK